MNRIYYTIKQAADVLRVSVRTLHYWRNAGKIDQPVMHADGRNYWPRTYIDAMAPEPTPPPVAYPLSWDRSQRTSWAVSDRRVG